MQSVFQGLKFEISLSYLLTLLHEDFLDRDLQGVIIAIFTIIKKPDLLSASLINSRIDPISVTEYGEVETLEVKESTRIQHTTV